MTRDYVYDQGFAQERARLSAMESSAVVDAGLLSAEEADAASARFRDNMRVYTPMMMAGIGRRP